MASDKKKISYKWQFKARFRRHGFGWRSQPAVKRVKEAVSEIKKVARKDNILAAEGAVSFLEKVSPALEHVDSSSGAIGSAVNHAIEVLVEIIASASVDQKIRQKWLERLFEAHARDEMPYIERLADYWGSLCVTQELASYWADQLISITRHVLSPSRNPGEFFHGTSACLSALFTAGRYDEIISLVDEDSIWSYRRWAVKAIAAQGKDEEAIQYAESCRDPWASDFDIDSLCESILLSSGMVDQAYRQYGLTANRAGTYLAWFRAVAKKYPHKKPAEILGDLVEQTPGDEGKWFAAAKSAGLFEEAISLANRTPCSPQTLTRAARDFKKTNPLFAVEAGMAALKWLVQGYGYEISSLDVLNAYMYTMEAAKDAEIEKQTRDRIRILIANETSDNRFVSKVLGDKLDFS